MATVRTARLAKQWRKAVELLRHNLRHMADWTMPETQRRAVAERLAGPGARAVLVEEIGLGRDNLHLRIYAAEKPGRTERTGAAPLFVEKASRNLAEFRVTTALAGARRSPALAEVYRTALCADRFLVYMEHVGRAEPLPQQSENAAALARSLLRLAEDGRALEALPVLRNPKRLFRRLRQPFFDHLATHLPGGAARRDAVLAALEEVPLIMAHNDLNGSNILHAEGRDPLFVDFGSMGRNHAGADLNFIAAEAVNSGDSGFLRAVAGPYAGGLGLELRQVMLAAHLSAASLALNRAINQRGDRPFAQAARLFAAGADWL